jgi:hypothetical protein
MDDRMCVYKNMKNRERKRERKVGGNGGQGRGLNKVFG